MATATVLQGTWIASAIKVSSLPLKPYISFVFGIVTVDLFLEHLSCPFLRNFFKDELLNGWLSFSLCAVFSFRRRRIDQYHGENKYVPILLSFLAF